MKRSEFRPRHEHHDIIRDEHDEAEDERHYETEAKKYPKDSKTFRKLARSEKGHVKALKKLDKHVKERY